MERTGCARARVPTLTRSLALIILAAAPAWAQPGESTAAGPYKPQSAFYVELLGSGVAYSLNYDYRPARHFAVRAGFEAWGGSGGVAVGVPLTVSALFGSGNATAEIGGGPTIVGGTGEFSDFESNVIGSAFVAFRLQPPQEGFFMRAGIGPVFGGGGFLIWPLLSFGYTF